MVMYKQTISKETTTIYEDDDFRVHGEVLEGFFYMHVSVKNYSKAVRKRMKSVWEDVQKEVWLNGWDHIFSYNTNEKFAKLFGWRLVNKDLRMYVWELDLK